MALRTAVALASAGLVACADGDRLQYLEAPWAADSTVVVLALDESGEPANSRPPSVLSGQSRFEFDLELADSIPRLAFLEFSAGSRGAAGIERCEVALDGGESLLPAANASFTLGLEHEAPQFQASTATWTQNAPKFRTCSPTACDEITASSGSLEDHANWRIEGIAPVTETRVIVRLAQSSTTGPGRLLLVERPDEVLEAAELPMRLQGMVRLGNSLLYTAQDGVLYRSGLNLATLVATGTVPADLTLHPEFGGQAAIGFSYLHADATRIHPDGRVEPAPSSLRWAVHHLAFGPDGRAAAVRATTPPTTKDTAVSFFDGQQWRRAALPPEAEDAEQLRFEGAELFVLAEKAALRMSGPGVLSRLDYVPAPIGRKFSSLAPLGRGYVIAGHTGLLQRFDDTSLCSLNSGNNESMADLTVMSERTLVGGWKFTRQQIPQLIWIDDALYDQD